MKIMFEWFVLIVQYKFPIIHYARVTVVVSSYAICCSCIMNEHYITCYTVNLITHSHMNIETSKTLITISEWADCDFISSISSISLIPRHFFVKSFHNYVAIQSFVKNFVALISNRTGTW